MDTVSRHPSIQVAEAWDRDQRDLDYVPRTALCPLQCPVMVQYMLLPCVLWMEHEEGLAGTR